MRYVKARFQKDQREQAYRIYVTDTLRMIASNTGCGPAVSWLDFYKMKNPVQIKPGEAKRRIFRKLRGDTK